VVTSKKRQRSLFDEPEAGGNWLERPPLNPRPRLKEAIRQMLATSRFSRQQIAERMNRAFLAEGLPNRVTLPRLDSWAADSKPALPETVELPVLCWAAESALPLAALNGCLRLRLINEPEAPGGLTWPRWKMKASGWPSRLGGCGRRSRIRGSYE